MTFRACRRCTAARVGTHQLEVVVSWDTLDILDSTLLESFDDVLGKWDGAV